MKQTRRQNCRALATVFAIFLIGIIAAAFTAAAVLLREDVHRTVTLGSNAQLRQLLAAGMSDAIAHADSWNGEPKSIAWSVDLPTELRRQSAILSIQTVGSSPSMLKVHIKASLFGRNAEEDLQFHLANNQWELENVQLGPVRSLPSHARPL